MLPRGLTSLLDSGKNKSIAAAGPAAAAPAAAGAATRGGAASLQNAPFATPKHHATEGRNDLQINRKNKFPGGRNVPSEILLEPPKTCCPGLDVPSGFWKNKAIAAAGPAAAAPAAAAGAATRGGAASLQNAPFATPKHHATEGRNDLQINRKNKFPGGRNVPSEILLEILSYPILLSC